MHISNSEIKLLGKKNMKVQWGASLLAIILHAVLLACGNVIPVLGAIAIAGSPEFGLTYVFYDASKGEKINCWDLFKGFEIDFGETFLAAILMGIYTFLWTLLFIVPGIIKAYSYSMTYYLMVREPNLGASEAITKSREYMKGNKARLFLLDLSFIGWDILVGLTAGLLAVYVAPWQKHAKMVFFNDIYDRKNGVETEPVNTVNIDPEFVIIDENPVSNR